MEKIEENLLSNSSTAKEVSSTVTILQADNDLPCYNESEDFDDEIIEEVLKRHKPDDEDECDNDEIPPIRVSTKEAKKCIDQLRLFCMQSGNQESPAAALDLCPDFVQTMSVKNLHQKTLDNFVH